MASGLVLRGDTPASPVDLKCPLDGATNPLYLIDDLVLQTGTDAEPESSTPLQPMGKTLDGTNELPKDSDMTKYHQALKAFKAEQQHYKAAHAKLMGAMEVLLQVRRADAEYLEHAAEGKLGEDTLIVFYAPWCPHCQQFVLHDSKGNPLNAPLEVLRRDLASEDDTKDVIIARADTTEVAHADIPKKFHIPGIPSIYFVSKDGKATSFEGNPHNTKELKKFVADLHRAAYLKKLVRS
jgi:thiol-disulfide isomerase/thioredoxin